MKARGTLIRSHSLTETSLIVHWCTDEFGVIKTVAKGARRPKSPFRGKLDLFFLCEIEVHQARSGDLHTLKDLVIQRARLGLRRSYVETLAASYFAKLIDQIAEPDSPMPELADLLERGLNYLEENDIDLKAMQHFEKQMADCLGISEPGVPSHLSINDLFGRLPKQRQELLDRLGG